MPPRGRGGPGFGNRPGGGRGNPYPYCRFYPWLPRRWWAYPGYGNYGAMYPGAYGSGAWPGGHPASTQWVPGNMGAGVFRRGEGGNGPGY